MPASGRRRLLSTNRLLACMTRHKSDISSKFAPRGMTEEEIKGELNPIYRRAEIEEQRKKMFYAGLAVGTASMLAGAYGVLYFLDKLK